LIQKLGKIPLLGDTKILKLVLGNTKGGSITVPLTSCLAGLDQSALRIKTKIVSCHTVFAPDYSATGLEAKL
jgi:hypothetical protein